MKPVNLLRRVSFWLIGITLWSTWPTLGLAKPQFVVVDARGVAFKPGQTLTADTVVELKDGERLRVLGLDGRSIDLRGPRQGPLVAAAAALPVDRRQALSALITNRNARIGSAGLVRSGAAGLPVPGPWSIDISRAGTRCARVGERPVLWHPSPYDARISVIYPADRSWRADLGWSQGQSQLLMPELSPLDRPTTLIIGSDRDEKAITLLVVPASLNDPWLLVAWMLDRGCLQQADAMLRHLIEAIPDAGSLLP